MLKPAMAPCRAPSFPSTLQRLTSTPIVVTMSKQKEQAAVSPALQAVVTCMLFHPSRTVMVHCGPLRQTGARAEEGLPDAGVLIDLRYRSFAFRCQAKRCDLLLMGEVLLIHRNAYIDRLPQG